MKRTFLVTPKAKFSATLAIVLASLALSAVPTVRADALLPGGTINSPSSMIIASAPGPLLADTGAQAFSFVGDTGTVSELVFADSVTGNVDFVYQITVATNIIATLTGYNFAGFTTDVGYGTPANLQCGSSITCSGTLAPTSIGRSTDGTVVSFTFNPAISGATTYALEIQTNASGFTNGSIGLLDGGGATLSGYAPMGVPEPGPTTLLLVGLGVLSLFASTGLGKKVWPASA